eukprot:331392-Chlamydomonas_euryale.AAC.10
MPCGEAGRGRGRKTGLPPACRHRHKHRERRAPPRSAPPPALLARMFAAAGRASRSDGPSTVRQRVVGVPRGRKMPPAAGTRLRRRIMRATKAAGRTVAADRKRLGRPQSAAVPSACRREIYLARGSTRLCLPARDPHGPCLSPRLDLPRAAQGGTACSVSVDKHDAATAHRSRHCQPMVRHGAVCATCTRAGHAPVACAAFLAAGCAATSPAIVADANAVVAAGPAAPGLAADSVAQHGIGRGTWRAGCPPAHFAASSKLSTRSGTSARYS